MPDIRASLAGLAGKNLDEAGAANALAGTKGLELLGALNALAGTKGLGFNAVIRQITGGKGEARQALAAYYLSGAAPAPEPEPPVTEPAAVADKATLPLLIGMRL